MLNIKVRTEYSFRKAYGSVQKVIQTSGDAIGICDTGTWGHVPFSSACRKAGKKPLLGVEIGVVAEPTERTKQATNFMSFIARTNAGLQELYELVSKSTSNDNFYYFNRLGYSDLFDISDDILILTGTNPDWVCCHR